MAEARTGGAVAADIGAFVSGLTYESIPESARRTAERAFADTVGVTLAGSTQGAGSRSMAVASAEPGETTLLGRAEHSTLLTGTFANATAGHVLDFDDTALSATDGHPSVPVVAPLLALGEREGASGRDLITAYVAGYETQAALNAPISPGHYEAGWHATATIGTFGAAAAAASLLDLPASGVADALSIAASTPAGLKRNFGTMTKSIHAGQAARAGLTAALLAERGADADPAAIDGERGFFELYAGEEGVDRSAFPALGEAWAIETDGPDVKKFPCCYFTHSAIEGTATLLAEEGIDPEEIERVEVEASAGAADALQHDDPETGFEAKFSMPYTVAYAAVEGSVDLAAFEHGPTDDHTMEALRERMSLVVDPELPYDSTQATVSVVTRDGDRFERVQERPPGTHDDPLPEDEFRGKFEMCASRVLPSESVADAYQSLSSLRDVDDVGSVTALL